MKVLQRRERMEQFTHQLITFLGNLGYFGIALALMIEIIPSEIVLSYGGFLVSQGKLSFVGAFIAGVIGGTIAQIFLYWLGKYAGRPFFQKYGKYLFIKESHIDASERWFNKYGPFVIFTARFIPVVRHAISLPAGFSKMSLRLFLLYTLAAMIPWTILFMLLGMQLGTHWEAVKSVAGKYVTPIAILAVISLVLYLGWKTFKQKKRS
jgi:membrane protein DedA with SNARE-associated domain